MRLFGCGLLAAAGIWSGILAARYVSEETARCAAWCRMLELMTYELERFRTPLPELFASLSARLGGMPGELCGRVSAELSGTTGELCAAWNDALGDVPFAEREILRPLGAVLGCFGAEEQTAALAAARERMNGLCRTRERDLRDRRKVCVGVFSAAGFLLAVLLL